LLQITQIRSAEALRVLDLSEYGVAGSWPDSIAQPTALVCPESVVLPYGLTEIPEDCFKGCSRLAVIDTSLAPLQWLKLHSCEGCKRLASFKFPTSTRVLDVPFGGTSIQMIDLTETVAESVKIGGMTYLEELILPRRCGLRVQIGVPALRRVTLGRCEDSTLKHGRLEEVRFQGMDADAGFSPSFLKKLRPSSLSLRSWTNC
jgi:hypothetical protein